jgi:hypothetical protein
MKITITIKKGDVLNEAHKVTAYLAAHRTDKDGTPLYNSIASTDSQNEMLELYWRSAKSGICDLCKRFSPLILSKEDSNQSADDTAQFTFALEVSSNFDTDTLDSITNVIRTLMIDNVVSGWLSVVSPTEAALFVTDTQNNAKVLMRLLHHVKRPI